MHPGHEWFGVYRDRYGRNPFITQCWDEVMHLVSDNVTFKGCGRRFLDNVAFKGGFSCAYTAWRYATLLVDENCFSVPPFPFGPSSDAVVEGDTNEVLRNLGRDAP